MKRVFWVEDKETLNLSQNRKKRYRRLFLNGRDCLIVGATQNHWNERLGLINKRELFSSHDLVQSVVSKTVNWKAKMFKSA